ncbi:MAG: hypothetical protein A2898_02190 [Candidatus Kerfeldbacteria bacterium RIFCSPLOWO2_01_FULL_48_11]|uniref:DUF11 domain-containing protein n=1 Tax=Candidatus Kerfeldbacteria bacterium RIFCSPLOWO2_01_FULL_48_11 TaxID=1798543 RepID=A0A1G2B347_9BACT|nr:MAG: hypothetical protein UY34_C0015G0002 [Parcubacteria group bacterium GW2011_GWA2_48_9]KKW16369.1 MAG: hypothetical protein UY52_C0005G0004 [Parcubacteria group bacterium GW2011_GWC2_49_9]OGY83069.1 MAG: hypothetical protein A2898_02190 [Candidatus Kerfeldbacteria bacterium RIFCSPLOWO2_01_FULL_48_11]
MSTKKYKWLEKGLRIFVVVTSIAYFSSFATFITHPAYAAPASVWTTQVTCANPADQDANEYANGDTVYIRGKNFLANTTYYWTIMGNPGGASADPSQIVKSDDVVTDGDGFFCLAAYVVGSDGDLDDGVYTVDVYDNSDHEGGSKNDNYHVNGVLFGSISGTKYYDWNHDNETDVGDQTLAGWIIKLYSDDEVYLKETTTDGNGNYSFIDLLEDEYYVCEVVPFGWTHSYNAAGSWENGEYCKYVGVTTNENTGDVDFHNYLTGAIHGYKWNDLNGNGERDCEQLLSAAVFQDLIEIPVQDCEPLLSGWTVFIDEDGNGQLDEGEMNMVTDDGDHYGWYWFTDLEPGNYQLCEVSQGSWDQTFPLNENSNCHGISVPDGEGTCWGDLLQPLSLVENYVETPLMCNFGNMEIPPACGDGVVNQEFEECDGTDGVAGNQTCSVECAIEELEDPTPVVTLEKLCSPNPVSAGEDITYTLNWSVENADVTNVVLTDEIPADTTFVSASDPGAYDAVTNTVTWDLGTAGPGNYATTLTVMADSPIINGTEIANMAILTTEETQTIEGSCNVAVSSGPILTIEKLVDETVVNPGQTVNYTVKVTNSGTDAALNVVMTDTLPAGFTEEGTGNTTITHSFGNIDAGDTVSTSFAVVIGAGVKTGTFTNIVTATSDNYTDISAEVDLDVLIPKVLGEKVVEPKVLGDSTTLPVTGAGFLPLLTALTSVGMIAGGAWATRKELTKKRSK